MCWPLLYPHIIGGEAPPGLVTVSVSTPQSPTLGPSSGDTVEDVAKGPASTMVSKSILSLQTSEFALQNVYVQGSLSELVEYEVMMAYELFALVVAPQEIVNTQHTPNEEAHVPDAVPPSEEHSDVV